MIDPDIASDLSKADRIGLGRREQPHRLGLQRPLEITVVIGTARLHATSDGSSIIERL